MTLTGSSRNLRVGAMLALAVIVLDQTSKLYVLRGLRLEDAPPIRVAPFLDLSFVWNRGISYGMFQQHGDIGRWLLVGLSIAAVILIGVWMARTTSAWTVAALGLIAGGALGNAIDRAVYGAVVDFLHLHGGSVSLLDFPYIFNAGDAAISVGVVILLAESLLSKPRPA